MLMQKIGLKTKGLDSNAADRSLEEERQTYTRDGKKEPGFTSSVVPTLEEKLVSEYRIDYGNENGNGYANGNHNGQPSSMQNGHAKHDSRTASDPAEARADGELFGVPARGDTQRDQKVPGPSFEGGDADSEEEKAPSARGTIRRNLNAKPGSKAWSLPTPTPHPEEARGLRRQATLRTTWSVVAI